MYLAVIILLSKGLVLMGLNYKEIVGTFIGDKDILKMIKHFYDGNEHLGCGELDDIMESLDSGALMPLISYTCKYDGTTATIAIDYSQGYIGDTIMTIVGTDEAIVIPATSMDRDNRELEDFSGFADIVCYALWMHLVYRFKKMNGDQAEEDAERAYYSLVNPDYFKEEK